MSDSRVQVDTAGGVGQFRWEEQATDAVTLERAVSPAADDAIPAHDLRRLQCDIPATDHATMVTLYRCGFRREDRLRSALLIPSGHLVDVLICACLAVGPVYDSHGFSGVMNSVLPTKHVVAHVVLRDETGRVLLTETTYKEDWEFPGGMVDPDESPRTGGCRESLEEISLDIALGEPAITGWTPSHFGWGDAIEFIYDGGVLPDTIARCPALRNRELRAIHWIPREELPDRVSGPSARKINLPLNGYRGVTENGIWTP